MAERMVYPEWLEADEDVLAEEISQLESELYDSNEDFKEMRPASTSPTISASNICCFMPEKEKTWMN